MTIRAPRSWLFVALIAGLLLVVVALDAARQRGGDDRRRLDVQASRVAAIEACRHVQRFEDLVTSNDSADQVRDALDDAASSASDAARGDPRWVALHGGIQALEFALEADDARAARVGIDVVRAACEPLGAPARATESLTDDS